jgi:hypothetical protein
MPGHRSKPRSSCFQQFWSTSINELPSHEI